ncbi:hypothetical protein CONLIGDRAFT_641331 [Coniochaeta ligniaria NRRL 30616]|uniref:Uncharacterized protein n=1 Tax=Coniochaeta ligniaria NRRL 30616 TaxID=1408157 RepID=A0A1J7JDX7_9PEZI|nr:hypothetical protein CONLIGDRAFT_641331 [Coniochaeta ligniaria NRRL 30616]
MTPRFGYDEGEFNQANTQKDVYGRVNLVSKSGPRGKVCGIPFITEDEINSVVSGSGAQASFSNSNSAATTCVDTFKPIEGDDAGSEEETSFSTATNTTAVAGGTDDEDEGVAAPKGRSKGKAKGKGKDKPKSQSAHAQFAKIVKHAELPTIYHGFMFLGPAIAGAWRLPTRLITILAGKRGKWHQERIPHHAEFPCC